MTEAQPTITTEIERYLRKGDTDSYAEAWSGRFVERANRAHRDLRDALVDEVKRLAAGRTHRPVPEPNVVALTRRKVEPMVRGLFPQVEQEAVLGTIERSVVFVTSDNIERLLLEQAFHHSAWNLGNLYLASVDAELLGEAARDIVGFAEGTTSYVSPEYFAEDDPFADFIVHEAAHIFHNCKRSTVGLEETRRREWLLNIQYGQRETFAYSCEVYSRVLERSGSAAARRQEAADFSATASISDSRVDPTEVAEIVREAADARNGWNVILERCAPLQMSSRAR